jgi:K+-transporting ATPase ATPase C chain
MTRSKNENKIFPFQVGWHPLYSRAYCCKYCAKHITHPRSSSPVDIHVHRRMDIAGRLWSLFMKAQLRPAFTLLALLTIITGVVYPLTVTGLAQFLFPHQANGSLIVIDGKTYGSELIGQQFDDPNYFWGRPSAAGYNAAASSGSNLGPMNPLLEEVVKARIDALQAADPNNTLPIPVDLVTASASGLDPHISVAAALYQISRVAAARGVSEAEVTSLVAQYTEGRQFGIFGEPRVNVLLLNLALDGIQ